MTRRPARVAPLCLGHLGLLAIAHGCSPEPHVATDSGLRPRNELLVSIDTLRADMLGCYGDERTISHVLDALAGRGVLFERAYATSPWTLPSHGSFLTGLYPGSHFRSCRSGWPTSGSRPWPSSTPPCCACALA